MTNPLFWLVLSFVFVAVCLTIVLAVAIPALKELGRAARSAEKLFETLRREFPPTLEAIRLTGLEITDLTDDLSEGVQSAGQVVKQVDQTLSGARQQAQKVQLGTRSLFTGLRTAWKTFTRPQSPAPRSPDHLAPKPASKPLNSAPDTTRNPSTLAASPAVSLAEHSAQPIAPALEEIRGSHFIATSSDVIEQSQPPRPHPSAVPPQSTPVAVPRSAEEE